MMYREKSGDLDGDSRRNCKFEIAAIFSRVFSVRFDFPLSLGPVVEAAAVVLRSTEKKLSSNLQN
jgi:hypothetical protein